MSEQVGAAFPVGTRVRERAGLAEYPPRTGTVRGVFGDQATWITVHWDGAEEGAGTTYQYPTMDLERIDLSRAPERVLAPGIVQSDDTCDGKPRLADTRMPTDTARSWPDFEAYHRAYPHITPEQYERAACFEAGRRWAKERRKAKRQRKEDANG